MKVKTRKIVAIILLLLILFNAIPINSFATFITDMNSNAIFGVIDGTYENCGHEMHYANYDGVDYLLFCMEFNKLSPFGIEYTYNGEFLNQYKEQAPQYQKIAEMIYFGYTMEHGMGLPGADDFQDACATQQYIWEENGNAPDRDSWTGGVMSSDIYANWLTKTENRYNQYHSNVSFSGSTIQAEINETVVFNDTNGVLAHYETFNKNVNGVEFSHESGSNELRATPTTSASGGTAIFNSRDFGIYELMPNGARYDSSTMSNYMYINFSDGVVQDLMFSNYVDPSVFTAKVDVSACNIKVKKLNNLDNTISGCKFGIYSDSNCNNKISEGITNSNGEILFENLRPSTYYIKELSATTGYLLDTSIKQITVENGQTGEVIFKNNEPTGKILIYKTNDNNDKVGGATFVVKAEQDIKNVAGTKTYYTMGQEVARITSNNNTGIAEIAELHLGKYSIQEVQAPQGYLLNEQVYHANLEYKNSNTPVVEIKIEGVKNTEPTGKIIIYKTSEYEDKLTGAVFSVKANEEIKNVAKTKTLYHRGQEVAQITSQNGIAQIDGLPMGKYVVNEIQAPYGYLLNENTYQAELKYKDQITAVIELEIKGVIDNEPKGSIGIIKKDSKTGSIAQGDATLQDAVYKVYAKEDIYNVAHSVKFYSNGDLVATRTTNDRGECEDITELPLGKYKVKEEKAPKGYLIDRNEYEVNLTYKDQYTKVITGNANSTDKVKEMRVHIFKSGIKVNSGETPGLQGSEFTIKLKSAVERAYEQGYTYEEVWEGIDEYGNSVQVDNTRVAEAQIIAPTYEKIQTDENGDAYSGLLPYGTYIVKETITPIDYESAEDFTFTISEDESEIEDIAKKVKDIVVNNEQLESYVKLIKKDLKLDKVVSLNSATFKIKATKDIYDRATKKIIYKKGEYITQKVGRTTYNSFTTNSKNLVIPDNSHSDKFDFLGSVTVPLQLPVGTYEIEEIKVPEGFLQLEETIKFNIEGIRDFDVDQDGDSIIEVVVKNEQPTGTLTLNKEIAIREDVDTSIIDTSDLSEIEFKLSAKNTIKSPIDGSIIYKSGQEVNTYNLDKNGNLIVNELPMGNYELKEVKTLDGLVLNDEIYEVKFEQNDLTTKVYVVDLDISNDTTLFEFSKTDITGDKELPGAKLTVKDSNENIIDEWISSENKHTIEGLIVGKDYTLIEEIAPNGFVKATEIKFTVENTKEVQKVTMIDKVVEMSKVDVGGEEIEGATIQVINKDGNIVDEWVSEKEPHKINNLVEGEKYILHEEITAKGYVKATDIEFEVTYDKETEHIEMIDKIVEMSKTDIGGNEIEGAEIKVYDEDNNIVDEWTSTKESHIINGLEEGKTYILHEEVAPQGFVKATDIKFEVTEKKENQHIELINKIVEIIKTDLVTGEEIEGAELQVVDEEGNIIDKWTSSKEPHKVIGLEENKTYKLIEITAPYGYEISEEIEFIVTNEKVNQKIEMKDKPILKTIKLLKLDSDTKEVIKADFTFGIYEDEECTKLIKEVKSDISTGTVTFEDLRFGEYYIKELKQPENYKLSDNIVRIEINENGTFADGNLLEDNESICTFEFYNQSIPKVKTGNETNYALLIISIIVSLLEIIIGISILKKNRKNR